MSRRPTSIRGHALAVCLALGGCVSMPPEIHEVFAPPSPTENSHFRPQGTAVIAASPVCDSPVASSAVSASPAASPATSVSAAPSAAPSTAVSAPAAPGGVP